jgi:hypothetical protein
VFWKDRVLLRSFFFDSLAAVHRMDARRPPGGNISGYRRHCHQPRAHTNECRRIAGRHTEQLLNELSDRVSVQMAASESFENQHVQRAG